MRNPVFSNVMVCVVLWMALPQGRAAEYVWTGGSSGTGDAWRQANNWNPSSSQGGPVSGDVAVFGTNGSATSIGINFNDGRGLTNAVAAIVLTNGPDRSVSNRSPNSTGTLRLEGWHGLLLANHSAASVLTLQNGASSAMRIDLTTGGAIHVGAAAAGVVLGGPVVGQQGFVKTGAGWLRLRHSNSLAGPVVVSGGVLELSSATGGSLGSATGLRLESGASAVLTAPRQLGAGTSMDLAGGTLRGAGGVTVVEERAGTLTLSASSTIDLRASAIHFANSSAITWGTGAVLTITNWRGAPGGGLFFGTGGLTSTQLAQIYFADLGVQGAQLVGPEGELTPIPEAPVTAAAVALAAFIVWRERRWLERLLHRSPVAPSVGESSSPRDESHSAEG
jgi:autotransporter-associated beta strand protein